MTGLACACERKTPPAPPKPVKFEDLKPGMSQSQIIAILGKPYNTIRDKNGLDTWFYGGVPIIRERDNEKLGGAMVVFKGDTVLNVMPVLVTK